MVDGTIISKCDDSFKDSFFLSEDFDVLQINEYSIKPDGNCKLNCKKFCTEEFYERSSSLGEFKVNIANFEIITLDLKNLYRKLICFPLENEKFMGYHALLTMNQNINIK